MEALRLFLLKLATLSHYLFSILPKIQLFPIFVPVIEKILSLYFTLSCNLVQCTIDLDERTTMHFWGPAHRKFDKPNLVMIHGFGGNSKWQFLYQVGSLSKSFNLYLPDLLFFGKSTTTSTNRSDTFQAECVRSGLVGLGVDRCSVYAISYGGYVGYRMADNYPEMVDKVVIVSSGIGITEDLKLEQIKSVGLDVLDLLLPDKPEGLQLLAEMSIYKSNPFKWAPRFILQEFIEVMCNTNRRGKQELVEHLLANKTESDAKTISQETLLIWGDKDKVFPLSFGHHLRRKLGPHAKLEVIPDTGHAANVDSPASLNALITEFIFSSRMHSKMSAQLLTDV